MSKRPMPAVKALIEKNGKILILKTRFSDEEHIWTLPGGRVEYGEEPVEALHREIDEEVSLDVELNDCVGMYHFFMGPKDQGDQVVLTVYTAEIKDGVVNIKNNPADENIEGYQWIKPEKFVEKCGNQSLARLIKGFYEF